MAANGRDSNHTFASGSKEWGPQLTENMSVNGVFLTETEKEIVKLVSIIDKNSFDLLMKKRIAYSTMNINATGQYGVAVRMLDKVARLLNLLKNPDIDNLGESIEDTAIDLQNYARILQVMIKRGEW